MKNICLLGLAALLLAACAAEEETYTLDKQSNTIEFGTYIKQGARSVSKDAFVDGDVLGIYACQTIGDYPDAFTTNFWSNLAVTKGATGWTYSPLASWPTDTAEHLSFIAYYPRSTSQTSARSYPFTLGVDANGHQKDPMWCTVKDARISDRNGTMINGNEADAAFEPNSGPLNLKFNHMLSRVKVGVKLDAAYPGITVKLNSLTLSGICYTGSFIIAGNLNSGTWSVSGQTSFTLKATGDEDVALSDVATQLCDTLMIPQVVSSTPAYFNITYTHTLAEGGEKTVTKTIYLPGSWEQNKIYNYTIGLSLDVDNITISAEVGDMDEGSTLDAGFALPEAVDLGLSVKWASYDFGTVSPYNISPAFVFTDRYTSLSITSTYNYYHYTLTANQDRIKVNWGERWSTPTREQWTELVDNCTWTQTTVNGVNGYLVTSDNGNSIFLGNPYYWTCDYNTYNSYYHPYYFSIEDQGLSYGSAIDKNQSSSVKFPIRPVFK